LNNKIVCSKFLLRTYSVINFNEVRILRSMKTRKAFTMVELIFVIAIIGILSAIAIPKFSKTVSIAEISKAKSTIASARSALSMMRQKNILKGQTADINATAVGENFGTLLKFPVNACNALKCNGWSTNGTAFTFYGPTGNVVYNLTSNKLECDKTTPTPNLCNEYE